MLDDFFAYKEQSFWDVGGFLLMLLMLTPFVQNKLTFSL
jgi:hypothetical protein